MSMHTRPVFRPGKNIAIKVPPYQFVEIVQFYRDVIGLGEIQISSADSLYPSAVFDYGDKRLWIDSVDTVSQAEIWLELETDDPGGAAAYLDQQGIQRRDEIEPLPDGFTGFWVQNPAGIIHLITGEI